MLAAVVAVLLAQAPGVPPSPSAPPNPAPVPTEEAAPPPAPALPANGFTADFVDRHLLSFDFGMGGFRVRDSARAWTLGEGEGVEQVFALIPEAKALAQVAEHDYRIAKVLQLSGLGLSLTALAAVTVLALVATSATFVLPLLAGSLVACLVSLVLVVVSTPFAVSAQENVLNAVSTFNHGLVRRLEGPKACPGVPMAWVPGSAVEVFAD